MSKDDQIHWRNEFAKAALAFFCSNPIDLSKSDFAKNCFDVADAMVKEMIKRENK